MPTDWGDNILISHLSDEPELSEEFAAVFSELNERAELEAKARGGSIDAAGGGAGPHVVLDFGGVTYLNSSHIAQMLRMRKKLTELGRSLVLCSMSDDVWSVISLSGLDKIFRHAPDPMTALAGLQIENDPREDA